MPCLHTSRTSDLSAITKKFVRGHLEKQFSLGEGALDARRSEINSYIESAIEACLEPADDAADEQAVIGEQEPGAKKKRGGWGFVEVSPQLRAVIGEGDVSRGDIIQRIWTHIKANNLQDASDRRFILCDDALKQIFKSGRVSMFKMNKELTRHIWKPEVDESPMKPAVSASSKKSAPKTFQKSISKKDANSKTSAAKDKKKSAKAHSSSSSDKPKKLNGLQLPKLLDPKLADFMGSKQASRLEVIKKIWEHIKSKNLQSAENKSVINCDAPLKVLLGQETVRPAAMPTFCSYSSHYCAVHAFLVEQVPQPALLERLGLRPFLGNFDGSTCRPHEFFVCNEFCCQFINKNH